MNHILALDTSTEALSVALWHNEKIDTHFEMAPRLHAQKILPTIDALLNKHSLRICDVDGFVFGQGPGAFTGVRTAIGVVQGLALAYDKPCYGVSTLLALAEQARRTSAAQTVMTAIDARMGEIYGALYSYQNGQWQETISERVCKPTEFPSFDKPTLMGVGSGWETYANVLSQCSTGSITIEQVVSYPMAEDMLRLALVPLRRGEGLPAEHALPVYLRDKVAEKAQRS